MDVNVVWVPMGLEAVAGILNELDELGLSAEDGVSRVPGSAMALAEYVRNRATLEAAIATWQGARRHFVVRLDTDEIRRRVNASLEPLSRTERQFWRRRLNEEDAAQRPLSFLALSLDSEGRPVAAANTDPATELFLETHTEKVLAGAADPAAVLDLVDAIVRPYPVGLFVDGLGPVVVNDAYASPTVQQRFRDDLYHSPRVVWGREVNLLLLGLALQIEAAYDESRRLRDESDAFRAYGSTATHSVRSATARVPTSSCGTSPISPFAF
jgi:hypothetical protein